MILVGKKRRAIYAQWKCERRRIWYYKKRRFLPRRVRIIPSGERKP